MKKKIKLAATVLSLGAVLISGNLAFAAATDTTNNVNQIMNNDSISGMTNMMENSNVNEMMDAMDSPKGKEMMKSCNDFMESQQAEDGQSDSKDTSLKPKGTSTAL
ncbi:hypothetical protein [Niallia taxi]|uniref:hypothetical protein n=1 Tax=Niallia taxi TaxID=2499688 RepID=UPI002E1DC1FA|nr:hypothetical protein [Niallia taxi]